MRVSCGLLSGINAPHHASDAAEPVRNDRPEPGAGSSIEPLDSFAPSTPSATLYGYTHAFNEPVENAVQAADRRLLTASRWDRVRVQPVPTDNPLVNEAQRHLGRPYRWGGVDPARGLDCSGFTWNVYRRLGLPVPLVWFRNNKIDPRVRPHALEKNGMGWVKRPQPGDVVVFGRQHIGIYIGSLEGHALYISANHGGKRKAGRVDIMPVRSVGIRPVYFRYLAFRYLADGAPKMRSTRPSRRRKTARTQ